MTASVPGPIACLAREFPGWQIAIRLPGAPVCAAYWQSEDGRHRPYIVAGTPAELLDALRARTVAPQ